MNAVKRHFLSVLFFLLGLSLHAQEVIIKGDVLHAILREAVDNARVCIYQANSNTLLLEDSTAYQKKTVEMQGGYITSPDMHLGATFTMFLDKKNLPCRLRIEKAGFLPYETQLTGSMINKNTIQLGTIDLVPEKKDKNLETVTVRGTSIKMFYKGDTLIYNAAAFTVEQQDRLRDLVKKLPGAEFRDNGIYINGRLIDNLLISGKDFFKGNIDAALDNLPAYTVSRLSVYEKEGEMSELTGRDMHDKQYVMDVRLKREYIGTWIAKLEMDGGTQNMWGTQGMLMRMDDRQMFLTRFDFNNLGKERAMNDFADSGMFFYWGKRRYQSAEIDYYYEPNEHWKITANGQAKKRYSYTLTRTNTQTFLDPSDMMTRATDPNREKRTALSAQGSLRYRVPRKFSHELSYKFQYEDASKKNDAQSAAYFMDGKEGWGKLSLDSILAQSSDDLVYTLYNPSRSKAYAQQHDVKLKSALNIGSEVVQVTAKVTRNTQNKSEFENYFLTYSDKKNNERQQRYNRNRDHATQFDTKINYTHKFIEKKKQDGNISPFIYYKHNYGTASHPRYRLDWLDTADTTRLGLSSIGILPQAELLAQCIDAENSYFSTKNDHNAGAGLSASYKYIFNNTSELKLSFDIDMYYLHKRLDYNRNYTNQTVTRKGFFADPSAKMEWNGKSTDKEHRWFPTLTLSYQGNAQMAGLSNLLSLRDTSDPLNTFLGNSELKNAFKHSARLNFNLSNKKTRHSFYWNNSWTHIANETVMQSVYNAQTGARTYTPTNSSSNQKVSSNMSYSLPLDKKQKFWFSAGLRASYYQAPILQTTVTSTRDDNDNEMLHSWAFTPNTSISATLSENLETSMRWETEFNSIKQFSGNEKYRETCLNWNVNWKIFKGWKLRSDFYLNNYSGYKEESLNKTYVNWNAGLGKYFNIKDKLINTIHIYVEANDILNRNKALSTDITAYARTETYRNVMPRYILFSTTLFLNWTSKKKDAK